MSSSEPPLLIGRIPFLVCAPFFHASLDGFADSSFVDGSPRKLNALLSAGAVDCAPSSSLEYARHADQYLLLPGLCTSGRGEVKSVLLFSQVPWEQLDGKSVRLSEQSDTSNALFQVLSLFRFGIRPLPELQISVPGAEVLAQVAIGDEALRESQAGKWPHKYDLAEVWNDWQGSPLPFGLWILRADAWKNKREGVKRFFQHLQSSLKSFAADPEGALRAWSRQYPLPMPVKEALAFFPTTDYSLGQGQERSLRIFFGLCREAELLLPGTGTPLHFAGV